MSPNNSLENRIFKLSTGELVNPDEIENLIEKTCHYVKYVVVGQNEADNNMAFIFPNSDLYTHPDYMLTPLEGCFCPRNFEELGRCLTGCLKLVNHQIEDDTGKIRDFAMINSKSPLEDEPKNYLQIIEKYKSILHQTHGNKVHDDEEIYYIKNI